MAKLVRCWTDDGTPKANTAAQIWQDSITLTYADGKIYALNIPESVSNFRHGCFAVRRFLC